MERDKTREGTPCFTPLLVLYFPDSPNFLLDTSAIRRQVGIIQSATKEAVKAQRELTRSAVYSSFKNAFKIMKSGNYIPFSS
jgi:hypothetical protein